MSKAEAQALEYLAPRDESFWRWSADGQTAIWADGGTIAFRGEIRAVLAHLSPNGLPPFGAVVLLLAACREGWLEARSGAGILAGYARFLDSSSAHVASAAGLVISRIVPHHLEREVAELLEELDAVSGLPQELRKSTRAKQILAEVVFEPAEKALEPAEAAAVIQALDDGVAGEALQLRGDPDENYRALLTELEALRGGLANAREDRLALRSRTGLDQLIKPADVQVPPAQRARNLLHALRADPELSGIAQVAQQILAAVHIPRSLASPEELPVGGVSDLTHRGTFDRLLISELAQDDLTLAVRVAMNEALYLRRESPAQHPPPGRAILLDVGFGSGGFRGCSLRR